MSCSKNEDPKRNNWVFLLNFFSEICVLKIISGDQCDFVAPLSHKVQGGRLYALNVHKIRKHGEHNMDGTECEICHFNFMTNNGLLGN